MDSYYIKTVLVILSSFTHPGEHSIVRTTLHGGRCHIQSQQPSSSTVRGVRIQSGQPPTRTNLIKSRAYLLRSWSIRWTKIFPVPAVHPGLVSVRVPTCALSDLLGRLKIVGDVIAPSDHQAPVTDVKAVPVTTKSLSPTSRLSQ